jgi:surface polysaccharide O-acyltransferase-like enzyme
MAKFLAIIFNNISNKSMISEINEQIIELCASFAVAYSVFMIFLGECFFDGQ